MMGGGRLGGGGAEGSDLSCTECLLVCLAPLVP